MIKIMSRAAKSAFGGKKILSTALALAMALLMTAPGGAFATAGYTAAQVATHNSASNCWLIISGQVYNVTSFIPVHPGGNAIVPFCGTDATTVFNQIHGSSPTAAADLLTLLIGNVMTALTVPTNVTGVPTQTTAALTWTASTGGTAPITYSVLRNGTSVGTSTSASFIDAGLTASTTYSYVVNATDSATPTPATVSSAILSVTTLSTSSSTDTTKPTVSITAPVSRATVSGNLTIIVNAADNIGVTQSRLYIDGKLAATSTTSPFSFSWDTTKAKNGWHIIRVRAYDAAGNIGVSKFVLVKVNNTGSKHGHGNDDQNGNEGDHGQNGNQSSDSQTLKQGDN